MKTEYRNRFEELYDELESIKERRRSSDSENEIDALWEIERHFQSDLVDEFRSRIERIVWRDYKRYRKAKNNFIDLGSDIIWDDEVHDLIQILRGAGFEKFTFSSTASNSLENAWQFQKDEGCVLIGMVEINDHEKYVNGGNKVWVKTPALLFKL